MPVRIQRKRTKGFKLKSPNSLPIIYVGRPSKWGNPYKVGDLFSVATDGKRKYGEFNAEIATMMFREITLDPLVGNLRVADVKKELKGKNLACWCKLSEKCHADVLLKIANE